MNLLLLELKLHLFLPKETMHKCKEQFRLKRQPFPFPFLRCIKDLPVNVSV